MSVIGGMAALFGLLGTLGLLGRWWLSQTQTHSGTELREAGGAVPDVRVFGAIPRRAWHWQDRPKETAELGRALGRRGRAALVALPGQRGAGKSQLAAMYANRCVEEGYDLVAWINAETGPVTDLALLAEQLGVGGGVGETPEESAAAVRQWLERDGRARRLVVFDNVDDPDAVAGYLPRVGSTKVIITSNRQEFARMNGVIPVPVGMFTADQGQAFLRKATGLPASDDAVRVGVQLGWLPLGLAQAGAYIERLRLSYEQYLVALDGQDLDETLRRQAGADHPGVLKATQLSLASLSREDPHGDALRLARVLSLLSPDGVSRALLARAEQVMCLTGGLGHALDLLAAASMVTLSGPARKFFGGSRGCW